MANADIAAGIADLSIESKTLYAWLEAHEWTAASDGSWSKWLNDNVYARAHGAGSAFANAVAAACVDLNIDMPSFD